MKKFVFILPVEAPTKKEAKEYVKTLMPLGTFDMGEIKEVELDI